LPIQESVDVAVPLDVAYDAWSQFEDWPEFMHGLAGVDQVDDSTVRMTTVILGLQRDFTADIVDQRPKERIEWHVARGVGHSGVVTFHELAPRLTRIEVTIDVDPRGLLEQAALGLGLTRRTVVSDLHRFKAHVEMADQAEGGWRGTIEDGKVRNKQKASSRNGGRSKPKSRASGKRQGSSKSKSKQGSR
jgi:uncharacterized membrane protein